jgi:hypothetical protein
MVGSVSDFVSGGGGGGVSAVRDIDLKFSLGSIVHILRNSPSCGNHSEIMKLTVDGG